MKQPVGRIITLLIAVALAGGGGYWYGIHHAAEPAEEATTQPEVEKPVVEVVTEPLKMTSISETITAYGTVAAEPGNVKVLSVPFESRVIHVSITPGEQVFTGGDVVQIEASPDMLVALQDAKNAVTAAEIDLKRTEQRMADHLATNQELATSKQTLQSAKLKLDSLVQRGVGESHQLKAEAAGVVSKIDVQEGQIVAAGAPLVEVAAKNRIEAHLGVQPEDAGSLQRDQTVLLHTVDRSNPQPVEGKIRLVSQRVDPVTRLVNVSVSLPAETRYMLENFVAGEITKASASALVVPRDAALPEEDGGYVLYTVKDHHAVKHAVRIGLQNTTSVQIIGDGLADGDAVVVVGNYQLEDGMEVSLKSATTEPAEAPTTTPAEAKP